MKLISFESKSGPSIGAVIWVDNEETIVELPVLDTDIPYCMKQFLANSATMLEKAVAAISDVPEDAIYPINSVKLLPVVPNPSKILCVGLNYADHAKEFGDPIPSVPVIFSKTVNSLIADGAPIEIPSVSDKVDYEAELVVVIGKQGRNIPESQAINYVAGYCCGNDVSARDWQKERPGGQWFLGKSFDTFAPIGPWIVTKDEIANPNNLGIRSRLNGKTMQNSTTGNFIFPIEYLISYISQVITLNPGDLIFTGTPPGVGFGLNPPVFMRPGDIIEVEIEGIGTLRNPVR